MKFLIWHHSQRGESLLTVLLGVAIAGILVFVMAEFFANHNRSQSQLQEKIDRMAVRRYVLDTLDCGATVTEIPPDCDPGTLVSVRSNTSAHGVFITIPKNGKMTTFGAYGLRAQCAPCDTCPGGRMLQVQVARFTRAGGIAKDAIRGTDLDWDDLSKSGTNLAAIPIGCPLPYTK